METAVGVPAEFQAVAKGDLTPMMRQYVDICEEYDDTLVLFHVGDFYKAFGEAAETVARLCELTLTSREDSSGEYKMAGLRVESAESHFERLLDAGFRIAIAEQTEDPEAVSGVADRSVTRVITPGTLTEAELLDSASHQYVACLTGPSDEAPGPQRGQGSGPFGFAFCDVSTGDFYATSLPTVRAVREEVTRVRPREVVLGPELRSDARFQDLVLAQVSCPSTAFEAAAFDPETARDLVTEYFGALQGTVTSQTEVRACGALLEYAEYTRGGQQGTLEHVTRLTHYDPQEYMLVDDVALRSLELFDVRSGHGSQGQTVIDVLDATVTALGGRKLREWIRRPLRDQARIDRRLDGVEELVAESLARDELREELRAVYDLERLSSRIARERADARDLRSLQTTLRVVPALREAVSGTDAPILQEIRSNLSDLTDIRELIDDAIQVDPAADLTEGDLITDGYSEDLDELRETARAGKDWVASLEQRERERTGIDSLRVGHTSVHGYYIEVTKSHLDAVPDDYTRRQTLKNAERYVTPELKAREDEIVSAETRANDLEYELFREVRATIADETDRIQLVADHLARLDVLTAYAEVAAHNSYTRPTIRPAGSGYRIEDGRHPVVEQTEQEFVANDTALDDDQSFAVITGPNMSGKSTYMRQVALITILAQAGSFVPASAADIGVTDRVFTRIGASDDIAGGRSTFMIEMIELAEILSEATTESLVLLDEVGRGTSTTDGLAIACAVTEYLHETVGAYTLFATHHHELTDFVTDMPGCVNLHFSADQRDGEVIFHHDIARGAATASYGVDVASEAGIPDAVVRRSRELVETPETGDRRTPTVSPDDRTGARPFEPTDGSEPPLRTDGETAGRNRPDESMAVEEYEAVIATIRDLDVETTTPLEALELLADLSDAIERSR